MNEHHLKTGTEADLGYGKLFALVLRRRFTLIGVFLTVATLSAVASLLKTPTYTSSMQLLVESNYQEKQENRSSENSFYDSNLELDYSSQIILMNSSLLIQRALDLLKSDYPNITIEDIQKSLSVSQVLEDKIKTKIFEITYSSDNPSKTQKVLEAIKKVYQEYNLEQQQLRLVNGLKLINEELPNLQKRLNLAENNLAQFRQKHNLIDPQIQANSISGNLADIQKKQDENSANYQDFLARYKTLQQQINFSPQKAQKLARLSQSSRYQSLLNELQKIELNLIERRLKFTDTDEVIQQLLEKREKEQKLLKEEVAKVLGIPSQSNLESILQDKQLGKIDLQIVEELLKVQVTLEGLKAQGENLDKTKQQLQAKLNQSSNLLTEYSRLQLEVDILNSTIKQLLEAQQVFSIQIGRGGFNWNVIEPPKLGYKTSPKLIKYLLLGAVIGLFLGGVATFIQEMLDGVIHSEEDLKSELPFPFLGTIAEFSFPTKKSLFKIPGHKPPEEKLDWLIKAFEEPSFRESLTLVYKNIQLHRDIIKSIVVTSVTVDQNKSSILLGLGLSAVRLHKKVLLIDSDLHEPSLHLSINIDNGQGLSDLLQDDTLLPKPVLVNISGLNIDVITAGSTVKDPLRLLSSQGMKELIKYFEQIYDLVLLDAPCLVGQVDVFELASLCDGVVMVARINHINKSQIQLAKDILKNLNVIGIIAGGQAEKNQE